MYNSVNICYFALPFLNLSVRTNRNGLCMLCDLFAQYFYSLHNALLFLLMNIAVIHSFELLCSIPLCKYTTIWYVMEYYTAVKIQKSFLMLTDIWVGKFFNRFTKV